MTVVLVIAAALLAACVVSASPSTSRDPATPGATTPIGSASASPHDGASAGPAALSDAELKVRLIDRFGPLWYCDPDYWPVARQDEAALAIERWPEISGDAVTLNAISRHLGIAVSPPPTDAQKLEIYREWKVLRAIALVPAGAGRQAFDYLARPATGTGPGTRTKGTIDRLGSIAVESSAPAPEPMCPICLARGQPIDTPFGPAPVESLRLGDPVWTLDAHGRPEEAVVIALGSAAAPPGHQVVRLVLIDGRTVMASPRHPLADGRRFGDVRAGDVVQGSNVGSVTRLDYPDSETFDLLPAGPTGTYAVDGIWLRSTLRP
jgi:hypothetical protein